MAESTGLAHSGQGIILVNLGSPEAPTPAAVRAFLTRFLSDTRVVELPALFWQPLLRGVILPLRAKRVAHLYQSIWTDQGSPLTAITRRQVSALQACRPGDVVTFAMTYGNPSIQQTINQLRSQGIEKILLIPLYPQYSGTTTGPVYDQLAALFSSSRFVPDVHVIRDYYAREDYISALAASIKRHWAVEGQAEKLLFSFHGIPKRCVELGDPYHNHCQATAKAVASALALPDSAWQVAFQSRFGKAEWLQPYTDEVLAKLPREGITSVDVICPAFASDCLETLEEIEVGSREIFLHAGGRRFTRIPCLNDSPEQIGMLAAIADEYFGSIRSGLMMSGPAS